MWGILLEVDLIIGTLFIILVTLGVSICGNQAMCSFGFFPLYLLELSFSVELIPLDNRRSNFYLALSTIRLLLTTLLLSLILKMQSTVHLPLSHLPVRRNVLSQLVAIHCLARRPKNRKSKRVTRILKYRSSKWATQFDVFSNHTCMLRQF